MCGCGRASALFFSNPVMRGQNTVSLQLHRKIYATKYSYLHSPIPTRCKWSLQLPINQFAQRVLHHKRYCHTRFHKKSPSRCTTELEKSKSSAIRKIPSYRLGNTNSSFQDTFSSKFSLSGWSSMSNVKGSIC